MPLFNDFYLVGGTALALQLGHRVSVDLDLFTPFPFEKEEVINIIQEDFSAYIESEGQSMLITNINGIKVDFVKMSYPILFPTLFDEGVRMLDMRDIAAMKLKAVAQRGSKKDFFDIYFLLKYLMLDEMLKLFSEKFKQHETFHIVKSLLYFEDAEQYPNPILFDSDISWEIVKNKITDAVKHI